ncbi:spore germination protein KA [Anoxybacillus voinovskiensis]|uniref:Spore germination protein KA n=1 Tax=Anoxybacteroides voinovskiense TaxID=230470 RepID=A0A840DMW2_9BACL|nr:spore germination protein [Anoxybacillus voinovskiensis]MBB4073003.1 spore germination protein KA [Anoxybacillus voinovskiensis]GGJ60185.1 spore germination protein [Anoxybacillus voinovskiensis]
MQFFKQRRKQTNKENVPAMEREHKQPEAVVLSADITQNIQTLQTIYENCCDVVFRSFRIGGEVNATILYIDGLVNVEQLNIAVLPSLMTKQAAEATTLASFLKESLPVSSLTTVQTVAECIEQLSSGSCVLLIDKQPEAVALSIAKWEKRSLEEPTGEGVIRGPREGFTESISTNLSLLRRKLKSPKLKTKAKTFGTYTQTTVVVTYIDGLASETLLEEVEVRLSRIDVDGIFETSYIEELIEDNPYSLFPQVINTERPDVVAANLLEGRVAILQDGTPFALIVPASFYSLLQSSEDYYQRHAISTMIRWLRYLFLLVSLLLPSLYVAVLTFHQEMVPTTLLLTMAASRELIPFPALVEALIMEIVFEALREAGVRLPKQAGAAVSIVGALVIGQAAVQAGIVSAPMIMVVALTGIASFTIPRYAAGIALRMLRFPMILLAGSLGLLGVMLGLLLILIHMATLRSFGVPYLSPMAPMQWEEMKDVLVRVPLWKQNKRPRLTGTKNRTRQAPNQKPDPLEGDDQLSKGGQS